MSAPDQAPEIAWRPQASDPTPDPGFAEFMRSFREVTARLESTHEALSAQVERLKAELAESNERLRRSRSLAALGEMAAGIAHEIRNPLGAIALHAELLGEDVAGLPDAESSVAKIRRAASRLDRIVGDVLRFARLVPAPTDARSIVDLALADCEAILEREDVDLAVDVDGRCELAADAALVAQALSNLVRNAVEATRGLAHREVRISAREARLRTADGARRGFVVLAVEDTGPGIPAEARERIFNPFFTTREEGTGLGLAIVHRIVDAHGGMTACGEARGVGAGRPKGARLELALPVVPAAVAPGDGVSLGEAVHRRLGSSAGSDAIAG